VRTGKFKTQLDLGVNCGMMEKVWDELRKIEKEAELMQEEGTRRSKAISEAADKEAEKIISNSKIYANDEAKRLREASVKKANENRESMIKENEAAISRIKVAAKKRNEKAISFVVDQVLGNNSS